MLADTAVQQALLMAGDSYYDHTVERGAARPALEGAIDVDVAVIGAGSAGLHCAIELAEHGLSVAVLEASRIGAAASGRNGGQLLPGYSADLSVFRRALGDAGARRAWDLSLEGMAIVEEHARTAAPDHCEYMPGWMLLAARRSHVAGMKAWHRELTDDLGYGANVELVEGSAVRDLCQAEGFHGALIDHKAGHLNPLKLMLALARRAESLDVRIFEHSAVTATLPGQPSTVRTEHGQVRCRHIVVAANVFVDALGLPSARRIMPVGNTMIATEVLASEVADALCRKRYAGCDTNFMLDYFRVSADHRLLYGGASTYLRHQGPSRAVALEQNMRRRFPQLGATRIEYAWGGLLDVTANRAPDFGRIGEHLYYLQGFSGHGLNVSAIGARVVAEAILGEPERLALFERISHRTFPSSAWLRRGLLSMGTWWYRIRDQLG